MSIRTYIDYIGDDGMVTVAIDAEIGSDTEIATRGRIEADGGLIICEWQEASLDEGLG